MNGRDVIRASLESTRWLLPMYLEDLSDADLLVRPVPGANHIAWQLGHLTHSEVLMVKEQLPEAPYPKFPAGFAETHAAGNAGKDGPDGFLKKAEYLSLFERVRGASVETAARLSDADLDRPTTGQMAPFAPTLGAFLLLVSNHTLMHAGQFTAVRRKLGKPILF